jgi:hypothetical protein
MCSPSLENWYNFSQECHRVKILWMSCRYLEVLALIDFAALDEFQGCRVTNGCTSLQGQTVVQIDPQPSTLD